MHSQLLRDPPILPSESDRRVELHKIIVQMGAIMDVGRKVLVDAFFFTVPLASRHTLDVVHQPIVIGYTPHRELLKLHPEPNAQLSPTHERNKAE